MSLTGTTGFSPSEIQRAAMANAALSKTETAKRTVRVEKMPVGVSHQDLLDFFNGAVLALAGQPAAVATAPLKPVRAVQPKPGGAAHLIFRSVAGARVGLCLDGVAFRRAKLRIRMARVEESISQKNSTNNNATNRLSKSINNLKNSEGSDSQCPSPEESYLHSEELSNTVNSTTSHPDPTDVSLPELLGLMESVPHITPQWSQLQSNFTSNNFQSGTSNLSSAFSGPSASGPTGASVNAPPINC